MARKKEPEEFREKSKELNSAKKRTNSKRDKPDNTSTEMGKNDQSGENKGANTTGTENSNPDNTNTTPVTEVTQVQQTAVVETPAVTETVVQDNSNQGGGQQQGGGNQNTGSTLTDTSIEKIKDTNAQPNKDYNPLMKPVDEKVYMTKPKVEGIPDSAPEPVFNMGNVNPIEAQKKAEEFKQTNGQTIPPSSSVTELDQKGKEIAATQLVDLILKGYGRLLDLGKWYVRRDEDEIMEMELEGKMDRNFTLPGDQKKKTQITMREFVKDFNEQSAKALTADPDFLAKVREPMIRLCIRKGWGVTDEEYLIYLWSEELAVKGSMLVGFKRSMNKSMNLWSKLYLISVGKGPKPHVEEQPNNNSQSNTTEKKEPGKTADDVPEEKKETAAEKKETEAVKA